LELLEKGDTRPLHQAIDSIRAKNPAAVRSDIANVHLFAHWPNATPQPQHKL
jgi:hypothetical protein